MTNLSQPITREQFIGIIPTDARLLEVGPYAKPQFSRPQYNVAYADLYTAEQIKNDVTKYGHTDSSVIPDKIDILINTEARPTFETNLKFDYIFSSHNIEHHPDIINHLKEMSHVASSTATKFFLAVPNKDYCFDHWQESSVFTEMIGAHRDGIVRHRYQKYLQSEIYRAHNDSALHWAGKSGDNPYDREISPEWIAQIQEVMQRADKLDTEYVDTHAWCFTPASFVRNINLLHALELQPWRVLTVFDTGYGSNEFFAILELT